MYAHKKVKDKLNSKIGHDMLTVYNVNNNVKSWSLNNVMICSIDPGEVNFAIRIEERYYGYENDGYILKCVNVIYYDCTNIVGTADVCSYSKLSLYFDNIFTILNMCHIFLIEKQLTENYTCVRINQHVVSYLLLKLHDSPLNPTIYDLHPSLKYEVFGLMKIKMSRYERKTKSVEIARDILTTRRDAVSLNILNSFRRHGKLKHDDLADVVTQIEAFFVHIGVSTYKPPHYCILPKVALELLSGYL